jgi:hypothetical protein
VAQNLEQILSAHGIGFRYSGRFEILTHCPLCGDSDRSEHLAISTRRRGWRCLRNPTQHKGRSYARLLTLLLRCSEERARELTGEEAAAPLPDQDEFSQQWRKQLGVDTELPSARKLVFPKEAKSLADGGYLTAGFWHYLTDPLPDGRGLSAEQARWAAEVYDLHYAISGRFAYRLIIPVYDRASQLMTWTARSIALDAEIRYLTLKSDEARARPGELLLGLPQLARAAPARCLVVAEGPFDAIALSVLGHSQGIWGTCIFGLELSDAQSDLLYSLSEHFERIVLLIDPAQAWLRTLGMRSRLPRRCQSLMVPEGFKDPGELVKTREGKAFVLSLAA